MDDISTCLRTWSFAQECDVYITASPKFPKVISGHIRPLIVSVSCPLSTERYRAMATLCILTKTARQCIVACVPLVSECLSTYCSWFQGLRQPPDSAHAARVSTSTTSWYCFYRRWKCPPNFLYSHAYAGYGRSRALQNHPPQLHGRLPALPSIIAMRATAYACSSLSPGGDSGGEDSYETTTAPASISASGTVVGATHLCVLETLGNPEALSAGVPWLSVSAPRAPRTPAAVRECAGSSAC
ncbi:hypothetical protein C8Q79DRAFT_966044 [Trametes meyenii]|nr:hypothetical protein C8Q79DRAFT_966044 [Trametes meyenii]